MIKRRHCNENAYKIEIISRNGSGLFLFKVNETVRDFYREYVGHDGIKFLTEGALHLLFGQFCAIINERSDIWREKS